MEDQNSLALDAYTAEFLEIYDSTTPDQYGSAGITAQEVKGLKILVKRVMEDVFGTRDISSLTGADKRCIKEIVRGIIIGEGWLQPDQVGACEVAQTAVAHACCVAEYLIRERGIEAGPDTYFSYTTKNRVDRFIYMTLVRSGKMQEGSSILQEWYGLQDRIPGYENENVKYPNDLDPTKIYGIAKAHRYCPAQLLRVIEELRLGRMSEGNREALGVGDTDVRRYAIPWVNFKEVIVNAESVDDIAVGVAVRTMEILHKRGLSDTQIVELLITGYSPRGPINEHGNIPEVHRLWSRILDSVSVSKAGINHLAGPLRQKVEGRIAETGNGFIYFGQVL